MRIFIHTSTHVYIPVLFQIHTYFCLKFSYTRLHPCPFPDTYLFLSEVFKHTFTSLCFSSYMILLSLRFYTQVYIPPSFFSSYIPISVCAGADISGSAAAASPAGHRAGRHVLRHQKTAGQRHVRSIRGDAHRLHLCRVGDPRLLPKDLRNV